VECDEDALLLRFMTLCASFKRFPLDAAMKCARAAADKNPKSLLPVCWRHIRERGFGPMGW
jgi:hypothetical protein